MPDPYFGSPFIDQDEWREGSVRYRYVHGGFEATDTRFAFYLPDPRYYAGRFVQFLEGGIYGGHEGDALHSPEEIAGTIEWLAQRFGAYYVTSNQGRAPVERRLDSVVSDNATVSAFRASAETARYGRELARDMYGSPPHHGYLMGGSGGGIRTCLGMENVFDVWDGGVPWVLADPTGANALTGPTPAAAIGVLGPKLTGVLDALEPGGGDPFAGLDAVETDALTSVFEDYGLPRRGFFQLTRPSPDWMTHEDIVAALGLDPAYNEDFWTVPGYAGADGELNDRLVDEKLQISEVLPIDALGPDVTDHLNLARVKVAVRCTSTLPSNAQFATVQVETGAAAGKRLTSYGPFGDVLVFGSLSGDVAGEVAAGDDITISNRAYLAACHRWRYPDRAPRELWGAQVASGLPLSGRFHGKMINVNSTLDGLTIAARSVKYANKVAEASGDQLDDRWRVYWVDNAGHTRRSSPPGERPVRKTRLINHMGVVAQALSHLVDWVERDVPPPPSTSYRFENGQLELPDAAAERRGIQPVVTATANDAKRAEVQVGEPVTFDVFVDVPPDGGIVKRVEWDFDGSGDFADGVSDLERGQTSVRARTTHSFDAPGTFFPSVRAISQHPDAADWPELADDTTWALFPTGFENLDRVRVVVRDA